MNTRKALVYFFAVLLLGVSSWGGYFLGQAEILADLGVTSSTYHDAKAYCEKKTGETCRIYGAQGFAPESMLKLRKPEGDSI